MPKEKEIKSKSIAFNGAFSIIAKFFSMLVPLITLPYILRSLGVESYGKVAYVQSVIAYFILFATLGISNYSMREIAIAKGQFEVLRKKVSLIFTIALLMTMASFAFFLIYSFLVPDANKELPLNLTFSLMIIGTGMLMDWYFNAFERFDLASMRDIAGRVLYIILCFVFISDERDYVVYAMILVSSQALIPMAINIYTIWKGNIGIVPKICFDSDFGQGMKAIFFLGLMTIGSKLFSSSDVILTKWFVSSNADEAVGLYNSGIILPLAIEQLLFTVAAVFSPRIFFCIGKGQDNEAMRLTNIASNIMYLIVVPSVLVCLFYPKFLLFMLGGYSYLSAAPVLQIYSLTQITMVAITIGGTRTYIARKKEKKLFFILLTMAFVNIILAIIFLKWMGIVGAAIATVVSNILLMTIELSLEHSWAFVFTMDKLKYFGGALVMGMVFLFSNIFQDVSQPYVIVLSIGIATFLYFVFLIMVKESSVMYCINRLINLYKNEKNIK